MGKKHYKLTVLENYMRSVADSYGVRLIKDPVADLGYILKGNLNEIEFLYKIQHKNVKNQPIEQADISKIFAGEHFDSDRFWIGANLTKFHYSTLNLKGFNKRFFEHSENKFMKTIHDSLNKYEIKGLGLGMSISGDIDLNNSKKAINDMNSVVEFFKKSKEVLYS